jgi:hypothetical protein
MQLSLLAMSALPPAVIYGVSHTGSVSIPESALLVVVGVALLSISKLLRK